MPFNSIDFAIFLPLVFFIYWLIALKNKTLQNLLIVVASYVFYGWWDWKFLFFITLTTLIDYTIGLGLLIQKNKTKRKFLLIISLVVNLSLLGFFKYYNFFIENFVRAFLIFGYEIKANSLHIILPIGISFYTFKSLSYTIDVYRQKIVPTKSLISYSAFVSFFPQLAAGPIDSATNLLPQFLKKREFNYVKAVDGLKQIIWGLFKKIVIGDTCAEYADIVFNNFVYFSGSTLLLGAIFFTIQIYADFSGYSDIAIGASKLFGFKLMKNFAFPYFSRDIAEFWRRWHISLTSWFKNYVYIPLGGSHGNNWKKIRNTIIIFLISGFWHGANWTFIFWGALNASYFLPLILMGKNRNNLDIVAQGKCLPSIHEIISIFNTFIITNIAWIFFRSKSIDQAFKYLFTIFSMSLFTIPDFSQMKKPFITFFILVVFIMIEWVGREQEYPIANLGINLRLPFRYAIYYSLVITILAFAGNPHQFIYFQF